MRKLCSFLFLLVALKLQAQYPITTINITLPANPDSRTANWGAGVNVFSINAMSKVVNGRVDPRIEGVKILVIIKKSGAKICGSFTSSSAPVANFTSINKIWNGVNAVSLLGQDCTLPAGEYEICVRFFGGPANEPLSEEKCKSFTIRSTEAISYQPPQLLIPANNTTITHNGAAMPLSFRWTSIVPRPQEPTTYRLQVWQLLQGQTAQQAVQVNQPIADEKIINTTQTLLKNFGSDPCPPYTCNFVWRVQALDRDGKPIGTNNGMSEVFTFYLDKNAKETPIILQSPANGTIIQSDQQTRFTWLPPKSANQAAVYKIKIVEILGDQSPEQAFKGNKPFFERDSSLPFRIIERNIFKKGSKYGWQVQAFDNERKTIGENEGKSKINVFSIDNGGKRSVMTTDTTTTASENTDTAGTAAVGDSIRAGLNGEFTVLVTDVTVETNGSLTGKGTVRIPWLKSCLMVEFKKIRVDSTKRLTQGTIISTQSGSTASSYQTYPQAWANALLSGPGIASATDNFFEWTNAKVNDLVDWVNDIVPGKQPLITYNDTIPTPTLPNSCLKLPFGLIFKKPEDMLVITEMIFKANESKINFIAQKLFTKGSTDYKLGFAGKYFKIHPNRIEFANGRVELVEDIKVPNVVSNPKMTFFFKKGAPAKGCYIQWDSLGVNDIGIGMSVKFTRDWLVPVPYSTDSVKATISGNGTSLSDIILTGSLDTCKIVGTQGVKLQVDSITWDLSEVRNPTSMYFPSNYTDDTTAQGKFLWQGLYIKKIKLTLPDAWKTGVNPTQIQATNGIIDDQGVTLKISAKNIIQFPIGRLADMSASLDTLDLSILKGSLTNGSAKGKLVLPISKDTVTNTLKYTATFAQVSTSNSFQIVIVPSGPIDADILRGKMTLKPTSNISAILTDTSRSLSLNLNGSFDWGNKDLSVTDTTTATGGASIRRKGIKGIKMEMEFQNVSVGYNRNIDTDVSKMTFNPGTWSFASPQKRLANFPVSIKKVYYKSLTTVSPANSNFKELVRGALMIDIVANLTDDIGGKTTVGAAFAIEQDKSSIKFSPKFRGVFIEDIEVHADMPAVKIDGKLKMYDNDPTFGDGFSASLGVRFTAVSVEANALVQFGNTTYNNNNQFYRYWRAEADVKFEPGIPFLPGIGFYGFGGGAFYNMEAIRQQRAAPGVGYKYTFKPKKSSLGFQVEATIATIPKFETFNADVSLLAQFTSSGGLTKIGFLGDFWLAAKLSEREPNPKIKGGVVVEYNFAQKIFYMGANLAINVPNVIKTTSPFGFVMNIDGTTNKWYFKAGIPNATNSIEIFGLNLYSYLMFGNDIPAPTGFTQKFANDYHAAMGEWPNNSKVASSNGVGPNSATGKGIAAGLGIKFSRDVTRNILNGVCRTWSIDGYVRAGAEINLALMQQNGCIGINGYRASGSLGLYGTVAAKIRGASFSNACDSKEYNLFVIKSGAWIIGKFPNPVYVAGTLSAQINLFNGLIDIPYSQPFQLGEDCIGTEVVTADAPAEDATADLHNQLIVSVSPTMQYDFPIKSPINVNYALVPDKVFDVAENQGNGTIINRTFKLMVTRKLEMKNASGVWVEVPTIVRPNNMGEYQYIKKLSQILTNSTSTASVNLNANNTFSLVSSTAQPFSSTSIPSPIPPPPPINYPNPTPDAVNSLDLNKDYRFTVEATLMEYKMNPFIPTTNAELATSGRSGGNLRLSWAPTTIKGTTNVVKQKKVVTFSTGPMQTIDTNNINQGATKK